MKSEVMKKQNILPVQNCKNLQNAGKIQYQDGYKVSHLILEHVRYIFHLSTKTTELTNK